jgi:hypothetical protein
VRERRPFPHSGTHSGPVRRLDDLALAADRIDGVRRGELLAGDRLIVATRNSIYALLALEDGSFEIAGGWYQRMGRGSVRMGVSGCSAGGTALFTRIVAAPGLFLEFEDGTRTTRIQRVRLRRLAAAS